MKQTSTLKKLGIAVLALALVGSAPMVLAQSSKNDTKTASDQKPTLYPNATRQAPKLDLTSQKELDNLNKGLNAANARDVKTAQTILQPIADGTQGKSKYAQALALQGMATLDYNQQNIKQAIKLQKQALANGIVPNDTYFQMMYTLAQFYAADEQYQPALDTLHKWRAEGKRETAKSYGLEGVVDYRLEKYPAAIAAINKAKSMTDKPESSWNQVLSASYAESGQSGQALALAQKQLAANPNDATTLHNTVALLVQAEKYPEALKLMEQARSNGTLKSENDYLTMAKLYMLIGQNSGSSSAADAKKAQVVLSEGMAKGIIKPSYETYTLQGQASALAGDNAGAVAAYSKASAMAKDGQADLYRAQLLNEMHKYSQARLSAKKAIKRGVKHMGSAYMLLAQSESALKNKPAAIAAMERSAQYPETKSRASAWLRKAGK